jgi:phage terminase large subunit
MSLSSKTTPVYDANYNAYIEGYPIICNEGGSRSSKSYSVMQLLIQIAVNEPMKRISCVSHSLPHIKRGVYRDFKLIMNELQLWDDNQFSYSDFIYTFKNGSYIELFGLEDEGKARGPGRDILFINEANLLTKPLFDQLAMRTTGQIFLDWNPADFVSWVYSVADNPKNKRIHSTYLNNKANLTESQINAIEAFKDLPDDFMWKVYGLGQRGAAKELIYTKWGISELPNKGEVFYGLDFGYNHPAALVKVEYHEGAHYVQELIYQSNLTLTELIRKMQTLDIGRGMIFADAAEPKSIEEIYRSGFNIHAANKDVWAGIVKVKSFPLYLTDSSTNLKREIQSYKWKKDKEDNIIEEPVKANDDGMDATRYAIYNYHDKPKFIFKPRSEW